MTQATPHHPIRVGVQLRQQHTTYQSYADAVRAPRIWALIRFGIGIISFPLLATLKEATSRVGRCSRPWPH